LEGIDVQKIEEKYNLTIVSNIDSTRDPVQKTTNLADLITSKKKETLVSFVDEKNKNNDIIFIDVHDGRRIGECSVGNKIIRCHWDRYPIPHDIYPLGCPIRYVSNKVTKSYYSEISKCVYRINESVTTKMEEKAVNLKDDRLEMFENNYYDTDGIFCSFNCCMAFIDSQAHDPMYTDSEILLVNLYRKINQIKIPIITRAPDWRLLEENGGTMKIEKFRKGFGTVEYLYKGMVSPPRMQSIGRMYEEKIKF
jgi:hypothetical protein